MKHVMISINSDEKFGTKKELLDLGLWLQVAYNSL